MTKFIQTAKNLSNAAKMTYNAGPVYAVSGFIIEIVIVGIGYIFLYISKLILDILSVGNDLSFSRILPYLLSFFVLTITVPFLYLIKDMVNERQRLKFGAFIDRTILEQSVQLSVDIFENKAFYDNIATLTANKPRLNGLIYRIFFLITNVLSFIISVTFAITSASVINVLLIAALCLPAFFIKNRYYTYIYDYEQKRRDKQRQMAYLSEISADKAASKELRFFNMSTFICDKYRDISKAYLQGYKTLINRRGMIESLFAALPIIGVMICMRAVITDISNGTGSIGDFVFMLGIYMNLQRSLIALAEDTARLHEADFALSAYNTFLALKPAVYDNGTIELTEPKSVTFDNVCFAYPHTDNNIFYNACFTINLKQKNAVVGVNGSGKTTFIKLLLRFYDVDKGRILINGINIKDYTIETLRGSFSALFQDYVTYAFTIRDNITFSDIANKYDDNGICAALKNAGFTADNFDFDTAVGKSFDENGVELSGGQKQKLAIARSMFSRAQVLIMDEPDASLDSISEKQLLQNINAAHINNGLIMISHRLSNIRHMDRIYTFDNGGVIEEGTHTELMSQRGIYYELYTQQAEKYVGEFF